MLDFSKVQKKFLSVQLIDGNKFLVRMPTKKIFDILLKLKDAMATVNDPDTDTETAEAQLELIYDLTAEILSNNIGGRKITAEALSALFDVEDIQIFYNSYLDFATGRIAADPN